MLLLTLPGCVLPDKIVNTPTFEETIRRIIENPPHNKSDWIYLLFVLGSAFAGYWVKSFLGARNRSIIVKTPELPVETPVMQKQIDALNKRLTNARIVFPEEEKT